MSTSPVQSHREAIWETLRRVGKPDSRFHWDFSLFIADFEGNEAATAAVCALPSWKSAKRVFITPDNSTERLRREAIQDGKQLLVTTYGIRRGFLELDGSKVSASDVNWAATLDGLDQFATPRTLAELRGGPVLPLLVTGGSAVSSNGIRFGKGHGYFDLEWAILSEIGLTDAHSIVVDIVHQDQVVDEVLTGEPHDVPVDYIVTPRETIPVPVERRPGRVFWDLIPGSEHETIPPIVELASMTRP